MSTFIEPQNIRTDLDTQSRTSLNEDTVQEYAEAMESGQKFPPILVFQDESEDEYILADGFHRLAAHVQVTPDEPILAEVRPGTAEDARWESIGANKSHGLRRTNEDKRNAVKLALLHPNGVQKSDRQIAEHVGVHNVTVGRIRHELESSGALQQMETRTVQRGDQVYEQNTSGINKDRKTPPDGACCNDCSYFKDGVCERTGDDPLPWNKACDDFEPAEKYEESEDDDADDDYAETSGKPASKRRGTSAHQYRRLKDCMTVHLPDDNPQLFAVELRNSFKEPYLRTCMQALEHILNDVE